MNEILIGNILAAAGEGALVASAATLSKKTTIVLHTIALLLIAAANLVLGGIGGAVLNFLAVFRNVFFLNGKTDRSIRISFAVIMVAATLVVCWISGFSDRWFWLPLGANIMYTMCGHWKDSRFKAMCSVNFALWLPYDILIGNYVSAVADGVNIVLSIRAAVKNKKREDVTGFDEATQDNLDPNSTDHKST